jgi:hypothetical protein
MIDSDACLTHESLTRCGDGDGDAADDEVMMKFLSD